MLGKLGGHPGITGNKISLNLVSRTVTQTANVSMKPMAGASTPIGGATAPIIRFTPGPTGGVPVADIALMIGGILSNCVQFPLNCTPFYLNAQLFCITTKLYF